MNKTMQFLAFLLLSNSLYAKLTTDVVINTKDELLHFATLLSVRINTANHVYINEKNFINQNYDYYKDSVFKVIPQAVTDCVFRKNEFSDENLKNGVVIFNNTNPENYSLSNWCAVVLYNYLNVLFAQSINDMGCVLNIVKNHYGEKEYGTLIDSASYHIGEYLKLLEIISWFSNFVFEPEKNLFKAQHVTIVKYDDIENCGYGYICLDAGINVLYRKNDDIKYRTTERCLLLNIMCNKVQSTIKTYDAHCKECSVGIRFCFRVYDEYMEAFNSYGALCAYKSYYEKTSKKKSNIDNSCFEESLRKTEELKLNPLIYHINCLLDTIWIKRLVPDLDKTTCDENDPCQMKVEYMLISISLNKWLIDKYYFPREKFSNLKLIIPNEFDGCDVLVVHGLERQLKEKSHKGFKLEYKEENGQRYVMFTIPENSV